MKRKHNFAANITKNFACVRVMYVLCERRGMCAERRVGAL